MNDGEYAALKADIAVHGLREPIWIQNDAIIDGRHRWQACEELGIGCASREYEGDDLVAFVISLNLNRRHLNESQRAMVAASLANLADGQRADLKVGKSADLTPITQPEAAKMLNVSERLVRDAKVVERDGSDALVNAVKGGTVSVSAAADVAELSRQQQTEIVARGEKEILRVAREVKTRRALDRMAVRKAKAIEAAQETNALSGKSYKTSVISCAALPTLIPANSVDAIITDPPYPAEFLDCFTDLSRTALAVLKPGGHCVVMCGQSHLEEVLRRLREHLTYQWTLAYMTPGQSTQVFGRRIKSNWKPVIWLTKSTNEWEHIPDFISSDMNDKRFHEWGQSVGGMAQIIERFTVPKQLILDPFCGAGTTGVAALMLDRLFIGCDIDAEAIALSAKRLHGLDLKEAA